MKKTLSIVVIIAFSLTLAHCGTTTSSSGGTTTTSTVTTNLETVQSDLAPDSLNYTQNSAAASVSKAGDSGNPCAEAADLFDCQPILLQLYMNLAKNVLDAVTSIISGVGTAMGEVENGGSGTATWGTSSVQYSKTTDTDYSIILSANSTPIGYVDVNSNIYTVQMDLDNISSENTGGNVGKIQATVTYTDANTWSVAFLLTGMACSESDVAAPERIQIKVDKANGLWAGKAMLYGPRWYGNNTCSTEPTDATSMNFYTDFVGNDAAAKASVYMMQRNKNSLDDIANYGMDAIGDGFGGNTSAYVNPFCNPAGTLDALWGNNCSAINATVSAADYSASSNWVTPYDFYQLAITIPSSL
ncbi:MAG: hypothetical protein A3I09_01605 [Deltaproteobacteria bacterium RIFCSPLOWO2_02_FULL_47_10]|nr:MAG: hypothetical protein A3I09_01605 [Deltaproteobacteria bacterium RIFCSPLOWO2_02_FULL_47_10]